MFAKVEAFFHRVRRRLSRSEWAIRYLGLAPSQGTSEEPGLLIVQIDGLARTQLERAISGGRMPFLRRLLRREGYVLGTFYSGQPASTPAVQAELFYGVRAAVPAFSYYDRTKRCHGLMCEPDWVKEVEDALAAQNEGLLAGGSSWSNIYTGGAAQEESHFCAASIGMRDLWHSGGVRNFFFFLLFHFPSAVLIALLILFELLLASIDAIVGVLRGEKLRLELQLAISRAFVATGLREFIATMAAIDLARGLPIVHVNFVGYDEHAHRRGPGSGLAHLSLRGIDWAIKRLHRAAHRSSRRDYAVWIYSDHGQERATPFGPDTTEGIEKTLREALELAQQRDPAWRPRSQARPVMPWLARTRRARRYAATAALTPEEQATFTVAAMGPVAHVYFAHPTAPDRIQSLARLLVARHGVPGALWRDADGGVHWTHPSGEALVPEGLATLLPQAEPMRDEIARDLLALTKTTHAGDLVLLGWAPGQPPRSFAPERGAHGGPGPEETRGFTLLPLRTRLPAGSEHYVRPAALRAAALHFIGRGPLEVPKLVPASGDILTLRVMTYNTHSCGGVDGRVSPRRIARVIGAQAPDIVALQELDLGHRRSRAEDQAALIAKTLEMHVVFCPTVTRGEEHYGHAMLCRWPIEIVRRAFLPTDPAGWWDEPRSALWARVSLGARRINVITTHLGLGVRERLLQMQALLGPEWIGAIPPEEDAILCGDFNTMPGTVPYRLAANRLRDVQHALEGHSPRRTFSSFQPFTRIDHIFISAGLVPQQILVPRNQLTRVASDHLPLLADLATVPATAETTTRTPASP
ncbi:MAG: endonuclease/exonuclease/phosphatase family protein [Opitutae bacterium]|nr:endonuclease/exonuclease/phosphatase family protein [Opitutae bacterium]